MITSRAPTKIVAEGAYGDYEIVRIRKSPDNRKRFNEQALQELAESIKAMGVAQPILIRPVTPTAEQPEQFEIVAGERRWRASIIAGMETIPAVCRVLGDLDAAKIRILENLQREDPHPMEEAEGYQLLMLQHGFTADQLVGEVKKSRAYIYGRLKLCALSTEVREQFLENKISASTALLIARIPVPKLQVKALGEILKPQFGSEPMSYRQAATHVQSRYMLDLGMAIFKLTDSKLLASAGACVTCPKRAGNQPEVFEGVSANVCTDPDCFAEKRAAHHAAVIVQANKKGIAIYEGDEGSKLLQNSYAYSCGEFVQIGSAHLTYFERNAPHTKNGGYVGDYLSEDALPPVAALVKNSSGEPVALYKREAIQAALEAAGACETVEARSERLKAAAANGDPVGEPKLTAAQAAAAATAKANTKATTDETAFRVALYKRLRLRGAAGFTLQSLREFTKDAMNEFSLPVWALGDIYDFDTSSDAAIGRHIDQSGLPEIQLLLIDMLLGSTLQVDSWSVRNGVVDDDKFATVLAMARHEGIDPSEVREELFPSPIDATAMQYDDLAKFIRAYPARIDELTAVVMEHPRGELVGLLELAANHLGYLYIDGRFQPAPPASEQSTAGVSATSPDLQPPVLADDVDAEDLADQVDEQGQAAATAPAPGKAGTKKRGAAKSTPKAAEKPSVAAVAKKPAKSSKPEAKAGKTLTPAAAWPFPKSSTGKREAPSLPASAEVAP